MSLHRKLAKSIIAAYPDAIVRPTDDNDVLDIHLPALHPQEDAHFRFRTPNGRIRVSFCCSDRAFIEGRVAKSHILEFDPEGIRLSGDPELHGVEQGTAAALGLAREIAAPGSRFDRAGERPPTSSPTETPKRYRGLTAPVMASRLAHDSPVPSIPQAERSAPRPSTPPQAPEKSPPPRQAPSPQPAPPAKPAPRPQPAASEKSTPPAATLYQSSALPKQEPKPQSSLLSLATNALKRVGLATVVVLILAAAVSVARDQLREPDPSGKPPTLPALAQRIADSSGQVRVATGDFTLPARDTVQGDAIDTDISRRQDPRELVAFIETYAAAYRKADTAYMASFYSDSVDYFDRGVVGRAYVLKDKDAYFSRWPDIRVYTDSTLPQAERLVVTEKSDGVFDVEWRVLFTVSGRGQTRSGRALNRFVVALSAVQDMTIIGETSSVTERFD